MKTYSEFIAEAAPKRLKYVKIHHGTTETAAKQIQKSGFNTSDVDASTNMEIAHSFGNRKGGKTRVISFRIPKKDIKDAPPGKVVKTTGQRGVDKWGREHFSTVMNPDYAKKHITKDRVHVIDAPKIPLKYRDQYFKNHPNSRFKPRTQIRLRKKSEN